MFGTDTIIARATPPGEGGIAVIRVSGPEAIKAVDQVFLGRRLMRQPGYTISHGYIQEGARVKGKPSDSGKRARDRAVIDEVLVSVFRAPKSYTGENMIEITCHGGQASAQAIIRRLVLSGRCRPAEPGEFTRRAVLNGKLSLIQAEAIPDLIAARSENARLAAIAQLTGVFSRRVQMLSATLLAAETKLAGLLEFGEDLPPGILRKVEHDLKALSRDLTELLAQARNGELLRQGARLVIVGRANVGKSSLFNRLLNQEQAIVTAIAGTTRDCLEAELNINGMLVRLVDTAGKRRPADEIEQQAAEKTRQQSDRASALLVVLDDSQPATQADREILKATNNRPRIIVLNKCDIRSGCVTAAVDGSPRVSVSALTGAGIVRLRRMIARLFSGTTADFVGRERHRHNLQLAQAAIVRARQSHALDLRIAELRYARHALEELVGNAPSDDILDEVFHSFCVGK